MNSTVPTTLHIVSFDIPYPANYGGVIDVFYKIKTLNGLGVRIILHCFQYNRQPVPELEKYCQEVHYYRRKTGILSNLTFSPYIVISRKNEELVDRLLLDSFPILFEGLHSCYYLSDKRLRNRMKIYRESNIEHHYYFHLFRLQRNWFKKAYLLTESARLYLFQNKLKYADFMLVVSESDTCYLQKRFPGKRVEYLPSFHENDTVSIQTGRGGYALYHGNLAVEENENAALFLIEQVFSRLPFRLVVAGLRPTGRLREAAERFPNVELVDSPDDTTMQSLVANAQINLLITFQATGLKLKLLNALYQGRFCIASSQMLQGTGLESLCIVADSVEVIQSSVNEIFKCNFSTEECDKRKSLLSQLYSNRKNGERLLYYLQTLH